MAEHQIVDLGVAGSSPATPTALRPSARAQLGSRIDAMVAAIRALRDRIAGCPSNRHRLMPARAPDIYQPVATLSDATKTAGTGRRTRSSRPAITSATAAASRPTPPTRPEANRVW